ncbi:hypothetical protein FRC00_010618 [Tulasnella sp. 408]|nr:hypothetical protein FRC00_010618 [Tulasnella sp. 408]
MSFYRRSNPVPPPPAAGRGPTRGPSQYAGRPTSNPPGQAYQYGRPRGPPPGADQQLWAYFQSVDEDGPDELSKALVNGDWTAFDKDTVRMLMGLFDIGRKSFVILTEIKAVP